MRFKGNKKYIKTGVLYMRKGSANPVASTRYIRRNYKKPNYSNTNFDVYRNG